jgi:uncharacterized protein (UPF0333 family)
MKYKIFVKRCQKCEKQSNYFYITCYTGTMVDISDETKRQYIVIYM